MLSKTLGICITVLGLALNVSAACGQQDEPPVLGPDYHKPARKEPPAKEPVPKDPDTMFFVACDLTCDLTLDGVAVGRLNAGVIRQLAVTPGSHSLSAQTVDGKDRVRQDAVLLRGHQLAVGMKLGPIRDTRLKTQQQIDDLFAAIARQNLDNKASDAQTKVDQGNYAAALPVAQETCKGGSVVGCRVLGIMYLDGMAVTRDYPRARGYLDSSCKAKDQRACNALGSMDMFDADLPHDYTKASALVSAACDGGELRGCINLGILLENGAGVKKDPAQALVNYRKACDGGNLDGCAWLGNGIKNGLAGAPDPAAARPYLEKACNGGSAAGCEWLGGVMEAAGELAAARSTYQKACDGDATDGCVDAAALYVFGVGGPRNLVQARTILDRACKEDNAGACAVLGESYSADAQPDLMQGRALLHKSCDGGSTYGCFDLALNYENGYGAVEDFSHAHDQLQKACNQSDTYACEDLKRLDTGRVISDGGLTATSDNAAACDAYDLLVCERLVDEPDAAYVADMTSRQNAITIFETVFSIFRESCTGNNPRGCVALGEMYSRGIFVARNKKQARLYFKQACDDGWQTACFMDSR